MLRDISIYSESHLLREPRHFSTGYLAALRASFHEIRADYRSKTDGKTSLENRNTGGLFFAARYFYLWRTSPRGIWQRCARVFHEMRAVNRSQTDGKNSLENRNAGQLFLLRGISIYGESHLLREPRHFSTGYLAALRASFS